MNAHVHKQLYLENLKETVEIYRIFPHRPFDFMTRFVVWWYYLVFPFSHTAHTRVASWNKGYRTIEPARGFSHPIVVASLSLKLLYPLVLGSIGYILYTRQDTISPEVGVATFISSGILVYFICQSVTERLNRCDLARLMRIAHNQVYPHR